MEYKPTKASKNFGPFSVEKINSLLAAKTQDEIGNLTDPELLFKAVLHGRALHRMRYLVENPKIIKKRPRPLISFFNDCVDHATRRALCEPFCEARGISLDYNVVMHCEDRELRQAYAQAEQVGDEMAESLFRPPKKQRRQRTAPELRLELTMRPPSPAPGAPLPRRGSGRPR